MNRTVAEIIRGTAERMGNLFVNAIAKMVKNLKNLRLPTSIRCTSAFSVFAAELAKSRFIGMAKIYLLLLTADGSKLTPDIHIERGAHGVLTKNKISAKFFISRFCNHLSQKISCGRTPIFARGAHIHAKGREGFFENLNIGAANVRAFFIYAISFCF
jgi:hypothetical protein